MLCLRNTLRFGFLAACLLAVTSACGEDEQPHPEIVSVDVNPSAVAPGGTVSMTVELLHFEFTDEHEDHSFKHGDGGNNLGHLHVYMDSMETNPLAMPILAAFDVDIPDDAELGAHTLIVRLHDAAHLIIEPQVTAEAQITIE